MKDEGISTWHVGGWSSELLFWHWSEFAGREQEEVENASFLQMNRNVFYQK